MRRWLRLRVPSRGPRQEWAAAALFLSGVEGVELREEEVIAYLPAGPGSRTRLDRVARRLALLGLTWQAEELREEGWAEAWKAYWRPVPVGRRLWIVPSWHREAPLPEGALPLRLDPGMAFGTGEHESTRQALVLLEQALEGCPGARVLDCGTGSGILALAAACWGAGYVLAVDVDPVAVRVARENAARNGLADRIQVRRADARALCRRLPEASFHVAAANILAEVVAELAAPLARVLAPGGEAVLAGIVADRLPAVEEACARAGLEVRARLMRDGWCALRARRAA